MTSTKTSLVITHVEPDFRLAYDIKENIECYIARCGPDVYQLLAFYPLSPLIRYGRLFYSQTGELPSELGTILLAKEEEGHEIVVTGGYDGICLRKTLFGLKILGINPRILFDGVYPKID